MHADTLEKQALPIPRRLLRHLVLACVAAAGEIWGMSGAVAQTTELSFYTTVPRNLSEPMGQ
jgi:hypothetical protein